MGIEKLWVDGDRTIDACQALAARAKRDDAGS